MKHRLSILAFIVSTALLGFAQSNDVSEAEAAYTRTIQERAGKIVASLGMTNSSQADHVREVVVRQYRDLRDIHDQRDAAIKAVRAAQAETNVSKAVEAIREKSKIQLDRLHAEFLGRLSERLTREQIDEVKNGMTYNVLNVRWNAYLKMFPDLTDEQKRQIMDWLIEARELAMDQGSSGEKHAVFGKYKGRVNNYLSKAGYDLKKAEQNLRK